MLQDYFKLNITNNSIEEFNLAIRQGIPSAIFGLPETFKNYLVSTISKPVLYVVKDSLIGKSAVKDIQVFSSKTAVFIPSREEILTYAKAFSKDLVYDRLSALSKIKSANVIVITAQTLMQTLCTNVLSLELKKNQQGSLYDIIEKLIALGYSRCESIVGKGQFSVRGDILDVFPVTCENPFRLDFFADDLESIREFDVDTRKTIKFVDAINIIQATEFVFTDEDKKGLTKLLLSDINNSSKGQRSRLLELYEELSLAIENNDGDRLQSFAPACKNAGYLLDALNSETIVVFNEGKQVYDSAILYERETFERFNSLSADGEVFPFAKKYLMDVQNLKNRLSKFMQVGVQTLSSINPFFNPLRIINPNVGGMANYHHAFNEVFSDIKNWVYSGYNVLVCTGNTHRAEILCDDLLNLGISCTINAKADYNGVNICTCELGCGFIFHEDKFALIGSGNLYTKPYSSKKLKRNKQSFFTAPEVGDFCVHEVHGIGRVLGNKKITSQEGTKDYVAVEYAGGDVLYIPVEQMDILTRYLGGKTKPTLSRIGGKDFERIKRNVRESIKKMSFDLKRLYQERDEKKGFAFEEEDELQKAFDSAFPFEETPDQITAIKDVKRDMVSDKVMDRLICGDVGYGKTEVAFRAAFRAIVNGKQVCMLAPTTILTEQHFNTALERFKDFGVKIACLNRFKSTKQQNQIIDELKKGKIDFIIGTHRLLSKDIEFKDLGLLILDEEQRFGVEHKEKIKLLKSNVDAITLTATPIPRTLHMSLSGIREISTITTPPKKRLPVQTYVTEQTDSLIKDAITREINRGGQVFVLYNRVESISSFEKHLKSILPNLKITVAHGQMNERELENGIFQFYSGKSDVLLSTTIIENGIDLPKANTLIVIDADRLGLSSLYQLKGRVGRSDRLAYAYFTYQRDKILTNTAQERLNSIVEFAEMGSGIKIAMRDLEIRGAGNILGAEQHGHMDKIGYELYSKLLREELSGKQENMPELDIRVTAFIPEDYIESNVTRMDVYKQIAEIDYPTAEKEIINSLNDVYGEIPKETINLINIAVVKRLASIINVKEINLMHSQTCLVFDDYKVFSNKNLALALDCFGPRAKINMSGTPKIEFTEKFLDNAKMLDVIKEFLILAVN